MDKAIIARAPGGPETLDWVDWTPPAPGPGEVLVRHGAVGLNFIDTYFRSGLYPWPGEILIPGSEAAGRIEAVGPGVEGLPVGQRVAYTTRTGACCTARVLPADRLVPLPDAIPDEIAASIMLKGLTAQYLMTSSFPVREGQTVLVHAAAGGVGLLLGQWLAAKGVRAIGTAGGPEKTALARAHGYAEVIDYRAGDFVAPVMAATDGLGVDAVYDSVGQDTWRGSLACLKPRGMFVSFGQSSGLPDGFRLSDLAKGSLSATRPVLFDFIADPAELRTRAAELFAAVAEGTLTPRVGKTWPLAETAEAHRALESRATTGATVLLP
ncbi:quinone oxidoreductase [Rhodovulum sulfidophilum]|uniref:Quinone oxidoreductase n=1 Tax=Rhodovulum visakhapatnamense TaxID=364297 RepID=A0ABS1RJV2_9RHOB|nr:quinone oxidoreductase [Rhodovulum visakhapatnamense]MBL3570223.1 quinone oxidoreductase [Rhodovulum visakhapatnamense]MBL3578986.1 quinone oxidoreductase [Rhodovulum visakhapatnamense]OLS45010.1 quinone oxidoreductase [Rhodovulum sulfidophilum]